LTVADEGPIAVRSALGERSNAIGRRGSNGRTARFFTSAGEQADALI
jgi:hypothetical protein